MVTTNQVNLEQVCSLNIEQSRLLQLILGILGFGESHNNLTGSNAVSREYNISIINFAIINTDIVIKL